MTLPEVTHQDRLLTVNINDSAFPAMQGVTLIPLFLDRENGVWVMYGKFEPGVTLPKHFHTGTVHFFTTKGRWNYKEYPDDPQTAGSYLFEPAGSIHTFSVAEDAKEPAEGFFIVNGANVNFEGDAFVGITDAGSLEQAIIAAAKAGMAAMPNYISPKGGADFSVR